MSELQQITSTPAQVMPESITSLSDSQLEAMIVQKSQEIADTGADPTQSGQQEIPQMKPRINGQVSDGTSVNTQGQPPEAQPQVQNEPGVATTTFEQLQQKSGVKSPDDLATNFINLQREFSRKSQELAQARRTETVQPQPVAQPQPIVNDKERMNQAFVTDLAQDPLGTIAAVVSQLNQRDFKPFVEQQKDTALKNELIRLSSSPTTASFNLPEVQAEIKNVLTERPEYLSDLAGNMDILYTLAMGKLARNGVALSTQSPNRVVQNPAAGFMEGRNVPTQPQPNDPKTMPLDDLAKMIKNYQSQF